MLNWYKQAETSGANQYSAEVGVNIYGGSSNLRDYVSIEPLNKKASIPFMIEIEARQWGIKSIDITVMGEILIPIVITQVDHNGKEGPTQDKTLTVDMNQVRQEAYKSQGSVTLGDLDIYLDKNFNIDYSASTLIVYR